MQSSGSRQNKKTESNPQKRNVSFIANLENLEWFNNEKEELKRNGFCTTDEEAILLDFIYPKDKPFTKHVQKKRIGI